MQKVRHYFAVFLEVLSVLSLYSFRCLQHPATLLHHLSSQPPLPPSTIACRPSTTLLPLPCRRPWPTSSYPLESCSPWSPRPSTPLSCPLPLFPPRATRREPLRRGKGEGACLSTTPLHRLHNWMKPLENEYFAKSRVVLLWCYFALFESIFSPVISQKAKINLSRYFWSI